MDALTKIEFAKLIGLALLVMTLGLVALQARRASDHTVETFGLRLSVRTASLLAAGLAIALAVLVLFTLLPSSVPPPPS